MNVPCMAFWGTVDVLLMQAVFTLLPGMVGAARWLLAFGTGAGLVVGATAAGRTLKRWRCARKGTLPKRHGNTAADWVLAAVMFGVAVTVAIAATTLRSGYVAASSAAAAAAAASAPTVAIAIPAFGGHLTV